MNRHVGVTATRKGITPYQVELAYELLIGFEILHHGDCVKGDAKLDEIGHEMLMRVIQHPPSNPSLRAFCKLRPGDIMQVPKPYIPRDWDIVMESEALLGFPFTEYAELGSGTWATIRIARKLHRPVAIVFPSGNVDYERWKQDQAKG